MKPNAKDTHERSSDVENVTASQGEILGLIRDCKSPVKAYDLLRMLSERRGPVAPPTIYRALHALTAKGLIHRIECLNAYAACVGAAPCDHAFLIRARCGLTREIACAEASNTLRQTSTRAGFSPAHLTLEISGLCSECQPSPR